MEKSWFVRLPIGSPRRRSYGVNRFVLGLGQLHVVVVVAIHAKKPLFAMVFRFRLQVFQHVRNGELFGTVQARTDAVSSPCFRLHQVARPSVCLSVRPSGRPSVRFRFQPSRTRTAARRVNPGESLTVVRVRPVADLRGRRSSGSGRRAPPSAGTGTVYQEAPGRTQTVVRPVPVPTPRGRRRMLSGSILGVLRRPSASAPFRFRSFSGSVQSPILFLFVLRSGSFSVGSAGSQ